MDVPLYQVDAFTNRRFAGNPAAVCPLKSWLPDDVLQAIAAENNLAETAFFVPRAGGDFELRWFTPAVEVDLCGHATLATGHVLMTELEPQRERATFHTKSGPLYVSRAGQQLSMDFPAQPPKPFTPPAALLDALGAKPRATLIALDIHPVVVFDSAEQVRALQPDLAAIARLDTYFAVGITAPGTGPDADVDFVSRFFAPAKGVPEDPVTGSLHCRLTPYWAERLGKTSLRARQVSPRTGELACRLDGDRVHLAGDAVLVIRGTLSI